MKTTTQFTFSSLLLFLIFTSTGCHLFRQQPPVIQAPVAFRQAPTLESLIAHVNSNTQRIQSLEDKGASISVPGFPSIRASISMAPPKSFRLTGETMVTGKLIDLGSNDQEFWVWSKVGDWPGQLYARHDQFQNTAARQMLPVEPSWISQALGLAYFDPNDQHQGPYPTQDGKLEIRSTVNSPSGQMTKVTVIDPTYGWVTQQHVYDSNGQTLASALASDHRFDPAIGVSLPHQVDIHLPPAQMKMAITIYGYRYNHLRPDDNRWIRPQNSDTPSFNLANPNQIPGPSATPAIQGSPYSAPTQPVQANPYPAGPQQPGYPATPGYPQNYAPANNPAAPIYRQSQYDPPAIRGFEGRR
ncbi:MAG: hypothetical protein COA78_17860 [Blastopirellula sp.]|nr:MAG: hypothetical protein COA78_17860 [Blastopirellula sp.]